MKSGGLVAALALALALLAGLFWWLARDGSARSEVAGGSRASVASQAPAAPPPRVDAPSSSAPSESPASSQQREARGAASYAPRQGPTGSLLVHAVWGSSGKPAVGVELRVHRFGGPLSLHEAHARTDANGDALFDSLEAGLAEVRGDRSGYVPLAEIAAGARVQAELVLDPGSTVSGRVVDAGGRGVSGARVWIKSWGEWVSLAEADNSGRYRIDEVPPRAKLVATARDHAPSRVLSAAGAGGEAVQLDFELGTAATSVIGQVVNPDERAVSKAVVLLQYGHLGLFGDGSRWRAACDDEGRFEFHGVPPGKCQLIVQPAHFAPAVIERNVVLGERHELIVRVEPGAELAGVVRVDGKPAAGAMVVVFMSDGGLLDVWGGARTDTDGRYRIAGLPPGTQGAKAGLPVDSRPWSAEVDRGDFASAEAELELVAGRAVIWNPELTEKD